MSGAALLILAGCPTYSEESQRGSGEEDGAQVATGQEAAHADPDDAPGRAEDDRAAGEDDEVADPQAEAHGGALEPVMHRQRVDETGDDGWQEARSTNGGYRVEVPGAFDDYEMSRDDGEVMHVVQARAEGARFLAQCSEGGDPPAEQLDTIAEELPQLGNVQDDRAVSYQGHEGREIRLTAGANTTIAIRTLALDDALCQLVVEASGGPFPEEDSERFLESFDLVETP